MPHRCWAVVVVEPRFLVRKCGWNTAKLNIEEGPGPGYPHTEEEQYQVHPIGELKQLKGSFTVRMISKIEAMVQCKNN